MRKGVYPPLWLYAVPNGIRLAFFWFLPLAAGCYPPPSHMLWGER